MTSTDLVINIIGNAKSAVDALDEFGNKAKESESKWTAMKTGVTLGSAAIVAGVGSFAKDSIAAFSEAQDSQVQLERAYEKFPAIASVSIDALRALNTEVQHKTGFDDDALAAGQASLAQYGLTGDQIQKLTPLMADYAAKTGKDIGAAAEDMGKAVLGQGKALKAIGVDFKDAGSSGANFDQLMAGLDGTVGGFATTMGTTASGKMKILEQNFGDIQETVGEMLMPALTAITDIGVKFTTWLGQNPEIVQAVAIAVGVLTGAIIAANVAMWAMSMNPIVLLIMAIVIAVGILIAGIWLLVANWDTVVAWITQVWQGFVAWIGQVIDGFVAWWNGIWAAVGKWISDVWSGFVNGIVGIWNGFWAIISAALNLYVSFWVGVWNTVSGVVTTVWNAISTAIQAAWNWIDKNVFTPFKTGIDLLAKGFEVARAAIEKTWDGIKRAAAVPINFVLDTVWNKGLLSFWNDMVGSLGLGDLKLPRAKLVAFADGGVMPGYTPGRDVHQFWSPTGGALALSGGEAIMRPEFTRAVGGAAGVARINAAARRGQAFADGGVFDAGGLAQVGSFLSSMITDPIGTIQRQVIDGIIRPLMASQGGNVIGRAVGELPVRLFKSLGQMFKSKGIGQGTIGMGWQAMWQLVKAAIPGATLNDALRPAGTLTSTGSLSYHSLGRAIDIGPATMDTFNRALALFSNARELIYSPAGGRQLYNGAPYFWGEPVRSQHWDHVHIAMANGGLTNGPMVAMIGDNPGGRELVTPLDQAQEQLERVALAAVAQQTAGSSGRGIVVNVTAGAVGSPAELAKTITDALVTAVRQGAVSGSELRAAIGG